MTLQPLTVVNCAGLLQPGCSLLQLDGAAFLFGQKGWPKRSCPTGLFGVRLQRGELKLRPVSFSDDSCYLPPLRCPAVARMDPHDGEAEGYLIHGGRTPNNEISASLYVLTLDSRGCNRKVTLRCQEMALVGETPGQRYGHSLSVVHSHGRRAGVLFGGRSYSPPGSRTTDTWNRVADCPPLVFVIDLDFGCCSSHALPELGAEGQSFHLALARGDRVYLLGGHTLSSPSDARPPRLYWLRVELLQGRPALSCVALGDAGGIAVTSAIATRLGPAHEYVILGGYRSETQKRMECSRVVMDDAGIRIEPLESPKWTGDISHSRTWFGGSLGDGVALIGVPSEGRPAPGEAHYFYQVSFQTASEEREGEDAACSQESGATDDSAPLEDSEELYFGGRDPHELEVSEEEEDEDEDEAYNEEDEEDEAQAGYWAGCCAGCRVVDPHVWEPHYSTERRRPAMIYCSRGAGPGAGHWVHARCMGLSERRLMRLSEGRGKYFCPDHGGSGGQEVTQANLEVTPPRRRSPPPLALKRTPMKTQRQKTPAGLKMSPAKKSFLRRLFD